MTQLTERGFDEVAKRFRLLGDPARLRILDMLRRRGEMPVGDIADEIGCSVAHASRQLAKLRDASLLSRRQEGNTVFYGISAEWVFDLCGLVCGRLQVDDERSRKTPLLVAEKKQKKR